MGIRNRRQVYLENDRLRLVLLPGGGHIGAIELKENGVNPLWDPPWDTMDPSAYDPKAHPQFGGGVDARLLAGIAGHNLCFDIFGVPSEAEAAAGLGVHGEASSVDWDVEAGDGWLRAQADLPLAGMRFERHMELVPGSSRVAIAEKATNLTGIDRAVGWTQHATLGPPFLEKGRTLFEMSATRSKVIETEFAPGADRFVTAAEFDWPDVPLAAGGIGDLRQTVDIPASGGYTAHLMDPAEPQAFFAAYHPGQETLFGYVWKRSDFPWLGIWEENASRAHAPWNGRTLTAHGVRRLAFRRPGRRPLSGASYSAKAHWDGCRRDQPSVSSIRCSCAVPARRTFQGSDRDWGSTTSSAMPRGGLDPCAHRPGWCPRFFRSA